MSPQEVYILEVEEDVSIMLLAVAEVPEAVEAEATGMAEVQAEQRAALMPEVVAEVETGVEPVVQVS